MMRAKLPWILFAVSLAINIFFVVGVAYTMKARHDYAASPERRVEFVADRLDLSDDQRQGLLALLAKAEEQRAGARGDRGDRDQRRAAFLDELAKPTFSRDNFIAMMTERSSQRVEMFANITGELHSYLATLSPEQRAQFLDMAKERRFIRRLLFSRRGPRHW